LCASIVVVVVAAIGYRVFGGKSVVDDGDDDDPIDDNERYLYGIDTSNNGKEWNDDRRGDVTNGSFAGEDSSPTYEL
jgi:hypothetical protein